MEEGSWVEIGVVIEWASQCRYCTLPLNLTADDINTHANKTAYASCPRVLAQLMVVGRHVDFGDGSRLQIFRHANGEVRAIRDEPDFELDVDPFLAADFYLYQQQRLQHDPPVDSRINYSGHTGRWESDFLYTDASVSSFAKRMILTHFTGTHHTNLKSIHLNRRVGGGRLDGLLTYSHNFVASIIIEDEGDDNIVWVRVVTTEAPVAGVSEDAPFKDRFPETTQLARVALGRVAPYVFDGQEDDDSDDDDDSDGHGGGWDDMDDDSDGEDSGGDNASAEEESGD
ncbi:unnamed protein product [Vitrella brassicaformis CCMP3155]|uniref:Uncharacterized protein n=1 Tax=Vitrella brassicaformis (strain CCMP3155) TaxID=1169540 RepID=A0A0G4H5G1_VITBC|nr:unnamed protein product [Vitrella brassicaformis CCMP3155]|eukprot:CEM38864.1 unnamed protein product [Vitrella brassicaformis CCMP3155]